MSVLSVDCPSLSATLELPYSPAQPPARQLGLANLTLWLNSEITHQLMGCGISQGSRARELARKVAKSVVSKMDMSETQQQLVWLIRNEINSTLAAMGGHDHLHGGELTVVPTEMHHAMTRTPLPALHSILRVMGWYETPLRGMQFFFNKLIASFVPNSPST